MGKAGSRSWARFDDPSRVNLRKAARAALVVPALFALLVVTGNTPSALFGAFGSFAALVFSDFGGALPRRFRAYVGLLVAGGLLIALGTAAAGTVWPAVVLTLVVAFTVALLGALGGYFTAAATSATLGFVLAVMSPAVEADLADRELGWALGVLVAGVAAVALWPVHQRDRVRSAAVTVLDQAAACLASPAPARDLDHVRAATEDMASRQGVVYRPAGSITRERALVTLVLTTARLARLLDAMTAADRSESADTLPEYAALAHSTAATLDESARVLGGVGHATAEADALAVARDAHSRALERWAAATLDADDAATVVDRFASSFPLRRLSFAAAQIAQAAGLAAHDTARSRRDVSAALARAGATLRAHCNFRSVRFRNAARAGLGLAVAVLVAKTASVEHAFWVVLGALSVLRSNALGTGATALQALAGAVIGFGVASGVMVTVGGDDAWLWIMLPLVVFLAAYTPGAVNFVVGQASFTVFVVVLFNVLVPDGWRTGLVRVQDIAIGTGISVVVGALLWPRGARGVARRAFAELLRATNEHLRLALGATLDGDSPDAVHRAGATAAGANDRAVAALEDLALEHGGGHVDRQGWSTLLVDASVLAIASEGITRSASGHGIPAGCGAARAALDGEGRAVVTAVEREADRVEHAGITAAAVAAAARGTGPSVPLAVPAPLDDCLSGHAHDGLSGALALVWVHEWLALAGDRPR